MKPDQLFPGNSIFIGIDPDVEKSGVSYWDGKEFAGIGTIDFWGTITNLTAHKRYIKKVIIEAGWLNKKSNYHADGGNKRVGEAIAKNVGQNQMIGKLFEQFCIKEGIPYELVKPTKTKMNAEWFKKVTKWKDRTNSEMRDSALLVFGRK